MSISQKINPWQTADTNACSQPRLSRLQKALDESWRRQEERDVVPHTLWPGWRLHRLTHRPARGRPSTSLTSRSRQCHRVRKMVSRRLMCHPQRGRYEGVSLPIWQCLSKWRAFTNLTPCTEGWEKQGVTDVRLTEKAGRVCHTHTHTLNNKALG